MTLNSKQEQIVKNLEGAYLLNAAVGTGKTRVLTERIIYALKKGFYPKEILALTFTNRAADEMKMRIKDGVDDKSIFDALTISTFHSFCVEFIKEEASSIGINSDFIIVDEEEQLEILQSIFTDLKKDFPEKKREVMNLLSTYYKYKLELLQNELGHNIKIKKIHPDILEIAQMYSEKLKEQNCFDFDLLVLTVLEFLYKDKDINEKWSSKYKLIQLDEFQDTHLSEYLVLKELAKKHGNISLIGDMDQTIYAFRDSNPTFISKLFKHHFKDVSEINLDTNYRSSPYLINIFKSFLAKMMESKTKDLNTELKDHNDQKKTIDVFRAYDLREEVLWIVDNIKKIQSKDKNASIAVLLRYNLLVSDVASVFSENKIEHLTVDQFDFFKRQEVRDLFAYLKILFNKSDYISASRVLLKSAKGVGEETIKKINEDGRLCGMNISDFLNFNNYKLDEPYSELLKEMKQGRVVVFDTETTGINPLKSDVIQIYAREIINGKLGKEFHFYLKSELDVSSSFYVHRISNEFLEEEGRDAKEVLLELKDFIADSVVVGHNVLFDINMIVENSKRHNIDFKFNNYYDTLALSKRFLNLKNYKLSNIASHLNFQDATHSADDDVGATIDLLFYIVLELDKTKQLRTDLWSKYKSKFILLSSKINNWEQVSYEKRPAEVLSLIWQESGLHDYYNKDIKSSLRLKSFNTLHKFFVDRDDSDLSPRSSLQNLIHYSSLVKNIDFLGMENGKIPIVTVHQVKGLEFDYVFLAGLNEGSFPIYKADNMAEEERLFYVALTRAKKAIYLSHSQFNKYNYPVAKSRLISMIDSDYLNNI